MTDNLTTILLIRHSESAPVNNLAEADWPLSPIGHRQAASLADELINAGIVGVISSPYIRAMDTVQPLADHLGYPIVLLNELRERKLCDDIRDDWHDLIKKAWSDFNFALPNCESGFDCQQRIQKCLKDLAVQYAGETIAVCSHGNAIGLFLNYIDPSFGFAKWKNMKNPDIFCIDWRNGRPVWRSGYAAKCTEQGVSE